MLSDRNKGPKRLGITMANEITSLYRWHSLRLIFSAKCFRVCDASCAIPLFDAYKVLWHHLKKKCISPQPVIIYQINFYLILFKQYVWCTIGQIKWCNWQNTIAMKSNIAIGRTQYFTWGGTLGYNVHKPNKDLAEWQAECH